MTGWIIANVMGIGALGAWLVGLAFPPARAVRLRNALLFRPSQLEDFEWSPRKLPEGFLVERLPPSPLFARAVQALSPSALEGTWERALLLATYLTKHAQDRGPIQSDLDTTLRRILHGYGYCADFVKVFLGLAHAAGVFARQWSFAFDGFGGRGHVVAEVFDETRGRWLFIDVFNNFHVVDTKSGEPLSAFEFRDYLLGQREHATMVSNGAGRPGYVYPEKALEYYRAGLDQWYLVWGNAVFSYDAHPLVRLATRAAGGLGQLVATALGVHPSIRVLPTSRNIALIEQLRALRRRLLWVLGALAGMTTLLAIQIAAGSAFAIGAVPR